MSRIDDIRALGAGAPLRAAYEASKRAGGHAAVFGSIRRQQPIAPGVSPFVFGEVPASITAATLMAASEILDGAVRIFGQAVDLGIDPNWHAVGERDPSWPTIDWWKIDIRSNDRIGDVKWAWELGRHRHLVLLARAAFLEPNDPRFVTLLNEQLRSWLESNPPEKGVHWYSNLEISLRSIVWLQILALSGKAIDGDVAADMWSHLGHAGRHLLADLPYTVSTMRNNHLLGDALGLVAIGSAFGRDRWVQIGDRIFNAQLRRHMRADGSMVEDSLSYHRFVLEMLIVRELIGGASAEVGESMVAAAQFLCRLGALVGPVPQYGDWDEGRVLVSTGDPQDLAGSAVAALGLGGSGSTAKQRSLHDEAAWYTQTGVPVDPEPPEANGWDIGAGLSRIEGGDTVAWLKMGSGPSHGHADLSSVTVTRNGEVVVGDPGTGTYNGELEIRNHFRGSVSHNVMRINGAEQLKAHRAFRWLSSANGAVGPPLSIGSTTVAWGAHDAYSTDDRPCRVVRLLAVGASGAVAVRDLAECVHAGSLLTLQFPPGHGISGADSPDEFHIEPGDLTLTLRGTRTVELAEGEDAPFRGWWSGTYGSWEPASCITVELETGSEGGFDIHGSGERPIHLLSAVEWVDGMVRLRVTLGDREKSGELLLG